MKRNTYHLSAALALLLGLAACTQDELSSPSGRVEGAPMTFTATGLSSAGTRAPVDGDWEGVTTVAVRIGGDVKAYTVTPDATDNTRATLASDDPHYWTGHDAATVTAWWPYNGEEDLPAVKVRADQSGDEDFRESDLIAAEEQAVTYGAPTLAFAHRTALVRVALTTYTDGLASVQLTGLSTVDDNPAAITPHTEGNDTYAALVAPQTVTAGTAFITCTFTGGKSYVYRMRNTAEWKAGEEYTYTVSLAAAKDPGYTTTTDDNGRVTGYNVYTADGLKAWAEAAQSNPTLNCTLTADITLPKVAEGESNWMPVCTDDDNRYTGTFDGKKYTITGLTINLPEQDNVGLIGNLGSGGKVRNLTLAEVNITGHDYVGGVVGWNDDTVTGCAVLGNVSGNYSVGGVAGLNGDTMTACYHAAGDVSGNNTVGGVAGFNFQGTVTACYHAAGNVSGNDPVGGVAGYIYGPVTVCYWSGSPDTGIGAGSYDGDVTKVDGNITWQMAVTEMNKALTGTGWEYELIEGNELPTLKKE